MPVRDRLHKLKGVGDIAHASEGACSNYLVPQEQNCQAVLLEKSIHWVLTKLQQHVRSDWLKFLESSMVHMKWSATSRVSCTCSLQHLWSMNSDEFPG